RPDLLVLDIMLPDMSGLVVMRTVRERTTVPVILLTARRGDADKVRGLELGADDYVAKPFNPDELTARARAVLRRARQPVGGGDPVVRTKDVEIDLSRRVAKRNGEIVHVTRTEWNLLEELAKNAGKVMSNVELLTRV